MIGRRPLGATGLEVPALGLGAGHIGDPALPDREIDRLLGAALELGINLIDTARSYGASEERIGRFLAPRRDRVVVSTKIGYDIAGTADWTADCIRGGVDAALARLRTDWIDIVHLHSCPRELLERGDVIDALVSAVRAGKVRVAAYSGDNDAAAFAVGCGAFGSIQTSVSVCDQWAIDHLLAPAVTAGVGVIAKRPVANAPWRFDDCPPAHDVGEYWRRFRAMAIEPSVADADGGWPALALRFTLAQPGVASAIVGTRDVDHLRANAAIAALPPLGPAVIDRLRTAFAPHRDAWPGVI